MYFGKFEFGISHLKNNKLNLPIESCNIALFKHYIEIMITFLGQNTCKTDIPSEFFCYGG